jgi:hypothetical protein
MSTAEDFTVAPQEELQPWAQEALAQQEAPQTKDAASNDVLLFQVPALSVYDVEGLAKILADHPDLHEQILATAASFHGNNMVERALELRKQQTATAPAVAPKAEEITAPTVVAQQAEEQPKEEEGHWSDEPGWVVRARAFNAAHEDDVNLFNIATGFSCTVHGRVDPAAVARWQAENGVDPDGRIGKGTADAAWKLMPVEQAQPTQAAEPPVS